MGVPPNDPNLNDFSIEIKTYGFEDPPYFKTQPALMTRVYPPGTSLHSRV